MEYSVIFYKLEVYNRDEKQRIEADKFRILEFEVIYLMFFLVGFSAFFIKICYKFVMNLKYWFKIE